LGVDPRAVQRLVRPARFGTLRRARPLSDDWGFDRGQPIDRYYIESFLGEHRGDIRGDVLEVKDSGYTDRFGAGVTSRSVLDIDRGNPNATVVADLAVPASLPRQQFDCFILIQTLQFIFDTPGALSGAHQVLRSGGVLLATVPVTSRISHGLASDGEWWRFTVGSCRRLFGDTFGAGNVAVRSYGSMLTSIAFLAGVAAEEMTMTELNRQDAHFPVIVAVRAVKT
jgi:hypothetical protein